MSDWKKAWNLSKLELKNNKLWFLLSLLIFVSLAIALGLLFQLYMGEHIFFTEQNPGLYDLVFISIFVFLPYFIQPKIFLYQQIEGSLWATPYLIRLLHLSVPENIIIKSRFLTYLAKSLPSHILFLIVFYFTSRLKSDFMSPITFIVFSIIWLSFSIYAGCANPAIDAGNKFNTIIKRSLHTIIPALITFGIFLYIQFYTPYSIVAWTVLFSTKWPILSLITSVILSVIGMRFWMYSMHKTMKKLDYQ